MTCFFYPRPPPPPLLHAPSLRRRHHSAEEEDVHRRRFFSAPLQDREAVFLRPAPHRRQVRGGGGGGRAGEGRQGVPHQPGGHQEEAGWGILAMSENVVEYTIVPTIESTEQQVLVDIPAVKLQIFSSDIQNFLALGGTQTLISPPSHPDSPNLPIRSSLFPWWAGLSPKWSGCSTTKNPSYSR